MFKKWLTFEKEHGDEKGADYCKERARAFVEALSANKANGGDDEDDE